VTRVVAIARLSPSLFPFTPTGVQSIVHIAVVAEAPPYRGPDVSSRFARGLVNRRIFAMLLCGRILAGVRPVSSRQRAFGLLLCHVVDQCADVSLGLTLLGRPVLWESSKQGDNRGDVLACTGEAQGAIVVSDDPPSHVAGKEPGARIPPAPCELSF
jgi:hypothetical protein